MQLLTSALPFTWVISVRGSCREGHPIQPVLSTLKGSPKLKVWILPHSECQVLHVNKNSLEILSVRTMQSSKCLHYDCHRQELIYLLFSSTFLSLTCIFLLCKYWMNLLEKETSSFKHIYKPSTYITKVKETVFEWFSTEK